MRDVKAYTDKGFKERFVPRKAHWGGFTIEAQAGNGSTDYRLPSQIPSLYNNTIKL